MDVGADSARDELVHGDAAEARTVECVEARRHEKPVLGARCRAVFAGVTALGITAGIDEIILFAIIATPRSYHAVSAEIVAGGVRSIAIVSRVEDEGSGTGHGPQLGGFQMRKCL